MGSTTLIVAPARNRYSQTFVRNHIAHLPGPKVLLYGRAFKLETEDGRPLLSESSDARASVAERLGRGGPARKKARSEAVARFCREHDVGVAMAEFGLTAAAISGDLTRAGVPLVAHFHGYDAYSRDVLDEWLPRYRNMFERGTEVVVVSEHMREQLVRLGAPADRVHVVRVGIDPDRFTGAQPDQVPPGFLAVGRFVEKKAPVRAVEAFAAALAARPEARLTMVGDGPLLDETRARARALGVSDAVEFREPASSETIAELMRGSRALIQASVTAANGDREGTPVVVMEAMASGLPVVGTRHTGIGEIVEHDRTGLLSDEHDTGAMGAHIARLAADPALAARLGAAGAQVARERHTLEGSIRALSDVLEAARASGR